MKGTMSAVTVWYSSTTAPALANAMAQSGLLPKRDYGLSCLAMVGAVNELMCEWLMGEAPPSVAALTDELLSMFAALILGARALLPDA